MSDFIFPPNFDPFHNSIKPTNCRKRRNCSSYASANTPLHPKVKRQRIAENPRLSEAVKFAVDLLQEEFKLRKTASQDFPPDISPSHIRSAISKYEDAMTAAYTKSICCSCGGFVPTTDIRKIGERNVDLLQPLEGHLDQCGYHDGIWDFCISCHSAISKHKIPKFSFANSVNVTTCQQYPPVLDDLTPVEECLIATCHPLGTILKLRPGNHSSPANYTALRGHIIVIPQDPGPLLRILPSPLLKLHDHIRVFWLGKHRPTNNDLIPFLQVRKSKILAALQYLVDHNHLYHDIEINHTMMHNWPNEFIPPEIADNVICLQNPDHHEREGYTVSLENGNYENELQAAQDRAFAFDENDPLLSGSVYTDINGERADPNLRTIDNLLGIVTGEGQINEATEMPDEEHSHGQRDNPLISYAIRGQAKLLNSFNDPHFFTGAFPTLFPTGWGGHLDSRSIPVSLKAFAKWALNHHSRRFNSPCT
jgi:hypothetical protein